MRRLVALLAGLLTVLTLAPAGSSSAGGWAVSTLDPLPEMKPGSTVEIGFTVRQHGVTPVDLGDLPTGLADMPIGIAFTASDGERQIFAAESRGPVGHHVATVTVPEAGSYEWEVLQGPFAAQPLGSIDIGASGTTAAADVASSGDHGVEPLMVLRWSSLGLAIALGAVAAIDTVGRRRATQATNERA